MGSDLENKSVSRRFSQEMWSSTRVEGVPEGTGGGCPYPAIARDESIVRVQIWDELQQRPQDLR